VRRDDHVLQVARLPQCAPLVEVPRCIAVELPVAIEHNRRYPNRRHPQRLEVIQLLLDAFEVPRELSRYCWRCKLPSALLLEESPSKNRSVMYW